MDLTLPNYKIKGEKKNVKQITVFQALIILLKKHHAAPDHCITYRTVKELYLSGVKSKRDLETLNQLLQDESLQAFSISVGHQEVNEDPVRRYFESVLAYETLINAIEGLNGSKLKKLCDNLLKKQPLGNEGLNRLNKHWAALKKIINYSSAKNGWTLNKSSSKKKLYLLYKLHTWSAGVKPETHLAMSNNTTHFFSDLSRGRRKNSQNTVSTNFGIVKPNSPLIENDSIAIAPPFAINSCVTKFSYDPISLQPQIAFSNGVTPFVSSGSGCLYRQLLFIEQLLTENSFVYHSDQKQLESYFKCFISFGLFFMGNHSLNEFTSTLQLPDIQFLLHKLPGFSELTLNKLFQEQNTAAITDATWKTISYQDNILYLSTEEKKYPLVSKSFYQELKTPLSHLTINAELPKNRDLQEIALLILEGEMKIAADSSKAILWASLIGETQLLEFLINYDSNVNSAYVVMPKPVWNKEIAALDLALCGGHLIAAQLLIKAGARANYARNLINAHELKKIIDNKDVEALKKLSNRLRRHLVDNDSMQDTVLERGQYYTGQFFQGEGVSGNTTIYECSSPQSENDEEIVGMNFCTIS